MDKPSSSSESDEYSLVYNYLTRMFNMLKAPKLTAVQATDTLQIMGAIPDFIAKVSRFNKKNDGCNQFHQANTVRRILNDDFKIEI